MNILLTGSRGFIGSHLIKALRARGNNVIAWDLRDGLDIRAIESIDVRGMDAICHHAADSVLGAGMMSTVQHNILGTVALIEAAKQAGVKHFVFASTGAVYDDLDILTEESPIAARTAYAASKIAGEMYLQISGLSHTIFRYGNVYGEGQVTKGESALIPHALYHLIDGKPFAIHGDGTKARDWVYVGDIVKANVLAIEGKVNGTFNLGTGQSHSVSFICTLLAGLCGKPETVFAHDAEIPGEATNVQIVSDKAWSEMGWRAETDLTVGLQRTVEAWGK